MTTAAPEPAPTAAQAAALVAAVWLDAVLALDGDAEAAAATSADLVRRYAEPHRRYHTLTHVAAVLRDSAWLAHELGLTADERAVLTLAAGAHDVVYDARPGEDERASAAWAHVQLAEAGVAEPAVEQVAQLVLATLSHTADPADRPAVALLDADLAILAADPQTYRAYVAGVRAEYAAVDDAAWRAGRGAVLRELLDRPAMFVSDAGRHRWEAAARANVAAELAQLTGSA